ncbi:MAG: LbtU family siderophore porin [Gammaproteobacteria bacterium]|nr:LbtU family siderophore porin [Gammaproteobacteria bacterium]
MKKTCIKDIVLKKIFMRSVVTVLSVFSCAIDAEVSNPIDLDRSQNIIFDNFQYSTFSLQLLQSKSKFKDRNLIIGGSFQSDLQYWNGDKIESLPPVGSHYQNGDGIYLTQGTLDFMSNINSWSTIFGSVTDSAIGNNAQDGNYIFSEHALALFGNLKKSPIYLTTGINTIPFGVFQGSGSWDIPLTTSYFQPAQAPQISIGYYKNGFNAVATGFNDEVNYQNHFTYDLFYNKTSKVYGFSIGAGYLSNLKTNNNSTAAIHHVAIHTISRRDVGDLGQVIDINGGIQYRNATFNAEYNWGSKILNGNTNTPAAFSTIINYECPVLGKKTTFGLGYSETFNLKSVLTFLPGNDGLSMAIAGLKTAWAFNVTRAILANALYLGLDVEKITLNQENFLQEKNTYSYTLDLTAYL